MFSKNISNCQEKNDPCSIFFKIVVGHLNMNKLM
jgi:hypothetical protein